MSELELERESDNTLVGTRRFAAAPDAIFEAHVNAEVVRKWLLGPPGWSMPVCVSDARPGGKIHYVWRNEADGSEFSLTGEYQVVERPRRIIHVERMHLPEPTPDNNIETLFEADGDGTLMTIRMVLPDAAAVDAMLKTGMADGMEMSYARLDAGV